ncbi:MAG TPA: hypothetical protein HPP80_10860, partial [Rhodospirillaceae bacterium]|nr:hypothetical protein [Rhodospirillaceae bacterium]
MILRKLVIGLLSGFAMTLCANTLQAAEPAGGPDEVATCLKCHDRAPVDATAILKTPHAVKGDSR